MLLSGLRGKLRRSVSSPTDVLCLCEAARLLHEIVASKSMKLVERGIDKEGCELGHQFSQLIFSLVTNSHSSLTTSLLLSDPINRQTYQSAKQPFLGRATWLEEAAVERGGGGKRISEGTSKTLKITILGPLKTTILPMDWARWYYVRQQSDNRTKNTKLC